MKNRFLWPTVGAAALAGLIFAMTYANAQRPGLGGGGGFGGFMMPGRFVVAHATEKFVLVMDTATGQVYKVSDFKSELPRVGGDMPFPADGPGFDAKDRPRDRPPIREAKDARPRDRDRPPVRDARPPVRDRDPVRDGLKDAPRRDDRDPVLKGGRDTKPEPLRPSDIDKS
ncbi:MAG: hypothetical protein K2W96_19605, partial [Gemmataceae bacterium]|nr:hypothetical protein [Gemmataceae bacterium]